MWGFLLRFLIVNILFILVLFANDKNLLTQDEKNWIKSNPIVKIGVDSSWPPFEFVDEKGEHIGISSEYLKQISAKTGLKFEIYSNDWSSVMKKIKNKELDALSCAVETNERLEYLNFSTAYLVFDKVLVSRKDFKISSLDEIEKFRVVVQKSDYIYELLLEKFPNIKFIYATSNEEALKLISYGNADIYIDNLPVVNYYIEKDLLTNLEIKFSVKEFGQSKVAIATLKEKSVLNDIINKVLNSIKDSEKKEINKKWVFEKELRFHGIDFTLEELNWLKKNREILVAGDPAWPPFSYVENGKYVGIVPDLIHYMSQISKVNFKTVTSNSWTQSIDLLKKGKVQVLDAVSLNKKKSEFLDITSKYILSPIVIIGNENNKSYISSIQNLPNPQKIKLGVVENYSIVEKIKKGNPKIEKYVQFSTTEQALKSLSSHTIDYFIIDIPTFEYYSKKYNLSNLKIVGPTGYESEYGFAVAKGNKELLSILEKSLKQVPQVKRDEIYRKWIKLDYEQGIDYTLMWKIGIILFFVLFGTFYWNRKLKFQIIEKEKMQEQLEDERNHIEALNKELIKAKNSAENIAKQKGEFLANMSHEIRTPMNSVIGFAEILDKEIKDPVHKEYLDSIKKGGSSLLRIINDILDLSKIEAGKLEIKNESLNPTSLFLEIESIFHSKIISKNISFIVDIDKTIPKYIIIDGVRLRQILFNLIGNAIKFTEKGFIKLKVENIYKDKIKSKVDLIFSVEDSGIGVDEKNLELIFNAFEQESSTDSVKYGGTGLGLAICTKLVQMMNGKISVESQKHKGSKFTVHIYDIPVSSMVEEKSQNTLETDNIEFEKAQILVVDDIEENRKLVKASLKDYDIEIITAINGQDALEKLKNVSVQMVLMDLRMPVMDGYEAVTKIKEDKKLKEIPVVALTASVMGKDLQKVSEYGFDGYLRKPVVLKDLIEELAKYLKYSFKTNSSSVETKEKKIDKNSLIKVISILEEDLKEDWQEIKDGGDFTLIEQFAKRVEAIALEYDIYILKDYSDEMLKDIEAFDIEKVDFLLNSFEELIKRLKDMN
ncbi:hypothetical protein CRV07_05060 [Halarcobacter ebronensis]|uniref:histidine kinase n=1 Tax=Halarcobacter ebronensis TaxID=1462615 RepID=A0A4Q1AQ31_9BACT|nr:hypothetical protein CRV07_05060 [Halarcobacter ebronensis]